MTLRTYNHHGLKRNPFVFLDLPGVNKEFFLERNYPKIDIQRKKQFIQILGEKGFGKTTYLLHVEKNSTATYKYIPDGLRRICLLPIARYVLLDEIDRYPKIMLVFYMFIYRLIGTNIVIGTHADLSHISKLFGFETVCFEFEELSLEFLKAWMVKRLIKEQEGAEPPMPCDKTLLDILEKSNNSLREATILLHIWYAKYCYKT
jgi:hypothetical protein